MNISEARGFAYLGIREDRGEDQVIFNQRPLILDQLRGTLHHTLENDEIAVRLQKMGREILRLERHVDETRDQESQ
jgi:hypothetical protein